MVDELYAGVYDPDRPRVRKDKECGSGTAKAVRPNDRRVGNAGSQGSGQRSPGGNQVGGKAQSETDPRMDRVGKVLSGRVRAAPRGDQGRNFDSETRLGHPGGLPPKGDLPTRRPGGIQPQPPRPPQAQTPQPSVPSNDPRAPRHHPDGSPHGTDGSDASRSPESHRPGSNPKDQGRGQRTGKQGEAGQRGEMGQDKRAPKVMVVVAEEGALIN